jgi:hypothetical protein
MVKIDLITLARRVEALESALSVTLASLSTLAPGVKGDVVTNLRRHADEWKSQDETISAAANDLADRIVNLTVN